MNLGATPGSLFPSCVPHASGQAKRLPDENQADEYPTISYIRMILWEKTICKVA